MAKKKRRAGAAAKKRAPKPPAPEGQPRPREARPSKAERFEAERRARRRRAQLTRIRVIAGVAVVVVAIVGWQVTTRRNAQRTIAAMTSGACDYDTRSDRGSVGAHADQVSFSVDPPSGGVHVPTAARAGTYTAQTAPPDGQVVHSLEHGYVAIWYRPDLAAGELAALRDIAEDRPEDVLLLPRATLPVPVAATAWHRRLLCARPEPESIRRFADEYIGKGPEKVPRG